MKCNLVHWFKLTKCDHREKNSTEFEHNKFTCCLNRKIVKAPFHSFNKILVRVICCTTTWDSGK